MAENVRPPVAIRIVRPYETEDALLESELETIGKTSVVLIGAHPRPTGVILRFEVTLASGATVLRGEGRVLAHKENAFRGQPGLSLRFTRLDPRSKAVVDRATAIREARAQVEQPAGAARASRPPPAPLSDPALADALTQSTPAPAPTAPIAPAAPAQAEQRASEPPRKSPAEAAEEARARARAEANATARVNATRTRTGQLTPPPSPVHDMPTPAPTPVTSVPGLVAERPPSARAASSPPPPAPSAPPARAPTSTVATHRAAAGALEAPPDRSALLDRLRKRAEDLPAARVEEILASRR